IWHGDADRSMHHEDPLQVEGEGARGAYSKSRLIFSPAEDGIRDFHVTGVQTCALPISRARRARPCRPGPVARHARCGRAATGLQIGRASCRERVEIPGGAAALKKISYCVSEETRTMLTCEAADDMQGNSR